MNIIICDDDKNIVNQVHKYLNDFFKKNKFECMEELEISCFYSGEDIVCDTRSVDIAFLDVEMPGLSGIKAGQYLKKQCPNVLIFVITNYNEYLDEAMRLQVFRYLTKPIEPLRLYRNMRDALSIYCNNNTRLVVETKQGVYTVRIMDILCVEALGGKIIVHTVGEDCCYESIHNMQYWVEKLNQCCFFQSHRSFLVNMEYIEDFNHLSIHMTDSKVQPYLAKRKYKQFKDAYMFYIENTR